LASSMPRWLVRSSIIANTTAAIASAPQRSARRDPVPVSLRRPSPS
jgi:hypothetical protein